MMRRLWILLLLPVVVLPSCVMYAPRTPLGTPEDVPDQFSSGSESATDLGRWWELFGSAELNALVEEALTNSPTIQQAWARLSQAEAGSRISSSARLPSVKYDLSGTVSRDGARDETAELYSVGVAASYEVDLWGRVRSEAQAASLAATASREALGSAAMTLSAEVALTWMGLVAQRAQTDLLREQLEANRTSLELIELRFRKSLASALDVYQQRQVVAATASLIPQAELQERLLHNRLAALLGRADGTTLVVVAKDLPALAALPDVGIPAQVLANRPDVRSAAALLRSAEWSVSAAQADRLPTLRLTATDTYSSDRIENLFDDWFANLAAGLTGPIFEAGRRKAEVERTRAVAEERLAAYRAAVIDAVKDVEDALVSEQKQGDYFNAVRDRVAAARTTYDASVDRYRNGLTDYTTVLLQLNSLQSVEREAVVAEYNLLRYRVGLYRALGGSWIDDMARN